MKIPLIWLKDYIKTTKSAKEIAAAFTQLGLFLDKPIQNDVLNLEHRFDRADWLAIIGCARDLAAFLDEKFIFPKSAEQKGKPVTKNTQIAIKVECPDLVTRFSTRVFKNVRVGESPKWLKDRLEAYGMPSINNVVDITNFVMVEIGQPMHAQDLAKFEKPEIIIRRAKDDEEITTLDGTVVKLDKSMFVLANNNKAVVIGGVVGGQETGVTITTTDIILDAGNYNHTNIRQTSRKLKITNESVVRYDKFLHPHLTEIAMQRATLLILELAGGECFENVDYYPKPKPDKTMILRYNRLMKLTGFEIPVVKIKNILSLLDYEILSESESGLELKIPFFRTDIEVEDDTISDILRIGNYQNIPLALINTAPPKETTPKIYDYEDRVRDVLVNLGLHEQITEPLVAFEGPPQIKLENSQSLEKNALRTTAIPSLQQVASIYSKHGTKEIGLFEVGCSYAKNGSYQETRIVEVLYVKECAQPAEIHQKLKMILSGLLLNLGIKNISYEKDGLYYGKNLIGLIRPLSFTLYTQELLAIPEVNLRVVDEIRNDLKEDLALVADTKQAFGPIITQMQTFDKSIKDVTVLEEYVDPRLGDNKKSVLIRITFAQGVDTKSVKKTLLETLKTSFGILVRE